ncbi:UNVERIFIED_CONTAM: hypothetical protein Sradi_0169000 [Sesamum radiatum]|uniref:Tf2-1-like SH3-like domain-containing protein n=1 Tax=Sesamum radiatum TaxID=300843 RepID=A0AAW2W1K2_SESRA
MLEKYLRHSVRCTQKDWVKLLDVAQLCFNVQKGSSTNKIALEIATGQQSLLPHTIDSPQGVDSLSLEVSPKNGSKTLTSLEFAWRKAQKRMKKYANENCGFIEFNGGDIVMVKVTCNYRSHQGERSSVDAKYVGALPIIKRIGTMAYKIELPS